MHESLIITFYEGWVLEAGLKTCTDQGCFHRLQLYLGQAVSVLSDISDLSFLGVASVLQPYINSSDFLGQGGKNFLGYGQTKAKPSIP